MLSDGRQGRKRSRGCLVTATPTISGSDLGRRPVGMQSQVLSLTTALGDTLCGSCLCLVPLGRHHRSSFKVSNEGKETFPQDLGTSHTAQRYSDFVRVSKSKHSASRDALCPTGQSGVAIAYIHSCRDEVGRERHDRHLGHVVAVAQFRVRSNYENERQGMVDHGPCRHRPRVNYLVHPAINRRVRRPQRR